MTRRELLVLASAVRASAQFTSSVRVVNVQVTVRDRRGKLVRDLTKDDFELTDEGRKQEIGYFSADSDLPLIVGILFDTSGSQRTVLVQQQGATLTFLNKVLREGDRAFLAGFDQRYRVIAPLSNSVERMLEGLQKMNTDDPASRGTALFDAVARASESVAREPGRKAIIILSDGQDTASGAQLKQAIEEAQRANALLYPVRIFDREVFSFQVPGRASENLEAGRSGLEKLAKQTGGRLFDDRTPLADNFATIEEELRSQYSLGFAPGNYRPGYRKLRVKVKRDGLTVQARDGYYSTE
jgi:VWFA-related protein